MRGDQFYNLGKGRKKEKERSYRKKIVITSFWKTRESEGGKRRKRAETKCLSSFRKSVKALLEGKERRKVLVFSRKGGKE